MKRKRKRRRKRRRRRKCRETAKQKRTVDAVDRSTLVVSAKDKEIFRILDLVGQQQADGFE